MKHTSDYTIDDMEYIDDRLIDVERVLDDILIRLDNLEKAIN